MAELSGCQAGRIYLLPAKGINSIEEQAAAALAFREVAVLRDDEGVQSNWHTDAPVRDASGPNSMFRQAAWFFHLQQPPLGPWLYLEPDCIPLVADWLAQLETEYATAGKPFLGVKMTVGNESYLNGVAIYPQNVITLAPAIATRTMWQQFPEFEVAFDRAGGILSKAHASEKIQLEYRHAPFTDLKALKPGVVLFHGDGTGSLIDLLRGDHPVIPVLAPPTVEAPKPRPPVPAPLPPDATPDASNGNGTMARVKIPSATRQQIAFHCAQLVSIVGRNGHRRELLHRELRLAHLIKR